MKIHTYVNIFFMFSCFVLFVETGGINGYDPPAKSPPNLGSTPAISKEIHKAVTLKRSFEVGVSYLSLFMYTWLSQSYHKF